MHAARIAELLEPFLAHTLDACNSGPGPWPSEEPVVFSPAQLENISIYIDMLLRWNARVNLTAIRNEEEIVTRHFGESLFAARHLFPAHIEADAFVRQSDQNLAISLGDLGSGAGFPGIPVKLWAPEISLTLIESNQKKATFLREVVRALTLTGVDVKNVRAEDVVALDQTFDIVTLRAVERFIGVLPTAARLVAPTGQLAMLIGSSQLNEAQATLTGFSWHAEIPVPQSDARLLLVGTKEPRELIGGTKGTA